MSELLEISLYYSTHIYEDQEESKLNFISKVSFEGHRGQWSVPEALMVWTPHLAYKASGA